MQVLNIRKLHAVAAAALLLGTLSTPAFAAAPDTAQAASRSDSASSGAQSSAARREQRICVQRDEGVGTRVRGSICRSRAEWLRTEGFVPGED